VQWKGKSGPEVLNSYHEEALTSKKVKKAPCEMVRTRSQTPPKRLQHTKNRKDDLKMEVSKARPSQTGGGGKKDQALDGEGKANVGRLNSGGEVDDPERRLGCQASAGQTISTWRRLTGGEVAHRNTNEVHLLSLSFNSK